MTTSIFITVNGNYRQPIDIVQRDKDGNETSRTPSPIGPHNNPRGEQAFKSFYVTPNDPEGTVSLELRRDSYAQPEPTT